MSRFLLVPSRLAVLAVTAVALLSVLLPAPVVAAEPPAQRKVTAWIPHWDQPRAMQSFLEHADLYGYVSPFWYEMNADGTVRRYDGAEDARVLEGVRATGVPLVPTITNAFDPVRTSAVLGNDLARAAHVLAILTLVETRGYDGIDVDYESMAAEDHDAFSAFLRELAAPLHARGKLLTVAVHPKTSDAGTWSGPQAQDYAAIGAVADRVRVMAYDHAWSTSPAGPIAPLPWVEAVATYAASRIPPAKVELGLGLYGYDWVGSRGEGRMHEELESRRVAAGATRSWDPVAAEPSFRYTDGDDVAHTVHYADAQSVAARLPLVDRLGLAGVAFWRLGGEDPAVWAEVRSRWGTTSETTPEAAPALEPVPALKTAPVPGAEVTPEPAPVPAPAPLSLRVAGRSGALSWTPATTAVRGYRVLRSASAKGPWTQVAEVPASRFTDVRLPRGRRAWYAVQAVDAAGLTGPVSSAVRVGAR